MRNTAPEVPVSDELIQGENITPIVQTPTPTTTSVTKLVTAAAAANAYVFPVNPSCTPAVPSPVSATLVTTTRPASTPVQAQPHLASTTLNRSRATRGIHLNSVEVPIKKAQQFKHSLRDKICLLSSDATVSLVPDMTETRVEQESLMATAREATFAFTPSRDTAKPSASAEPAVDTVTPSSGMPPSTAMTYQQGLAEAIPFGLRRMVVPESMLANNSLEELRLLANFYGRSRL